MRKRRKCIAKPGYGVRLGVCETCPTLGGRCACRDKYQRKSKRTISSEE